MTYYDKYLKYKEKYLQARNEYESLIKCKSCSKESCNCTKQSENNYINEVQTGGNNKPELILFKAEWCGHCKNFKSVWDEIQNNFNNQVNIKTYDADTTSHKNYFNKYNVQGFPTLILVHNNKIVEYSGSRDINSVTDFVNSYIN
jgi:protein disulfide-isomerase A6